MNPLKLMQMKSSWDRFQKNHPRFLAFLNAVQRQGIREGMILEFKVTSPEGEELVTNMRVTADDIALFLELQEIAKSSQ